MSFYCRRLKILKIAKKSDLNTNQINRIIFFSDIDEIFICTHFMQSCLIAHYRIAYFFPSSHFRSFVRSFVQLYFSTKGGIIRFSFKLFERRGEKRKIQNQIIIVVVMLWIWFWLISSMFTFLSWRQCVPTKKMFMSELATKHHSWWNCSLWLCLVLVRKWSEMSNATHSTFIHFRQHW